MKNNISNKTEMVKLIKEIVVLITVLVTLAFFLIKYYASDENRKNINLTTQQLEVKNDTIGQTIDDPIGEEQVRDENDINTMSNEDIIKSTISLSSTQNEEELMTFDTVNFIIPSRLKGAKIMVDCIPVRILEYLPSMIRFLTPKKSIPQEIVIDTDEFRCQTSLDLINTETYPFPLNKFKKKSK